MMRAAKTRADHVWVDEPRNERSVNDNKPKGGLAGHEMSDLEGVPRQPAAEALTLYARLTHIDLFPIHPRHHTAHTAAPHVDAMDEGKSSTRRHGKARVTFTCIGSFLFHAALFAALLTTMAVIPDEPQEEAGDTVNVIMLGDSDADQSASGEESKQVQPQPEQIVADAVPVDTVQPDTAQPDTVQPETVQPDTTQAVQPTQTAQPVEPPKDETPVDPTPVQPTQEVTQVSPETVVSPEPEVLATSQPAETTVVQPMETSTVPPVTQPTETVPPVETQPVTPEQPVPDAVVTPTEKPVKKPVEVAKKQPPKRAKVKTGSGGENEQDSKKGSSEGTDTAQSDENSQNAGSRQGWGSAAVANYPGQVQTRIRRSVHVPSEYKRMDAAMTVRVRLTIGSSGALSGLSVVRSSGISELDEAVVAGIRNAAPFPPLPAEWGKPSWSFTQEVQVTGR